MQAPTKIAVAGATGRVGRHVVDVLRARGHEVVPMSRSAGVDVVTGDGLADALTGVTGVIDVASGSSPDHDEAVAFFTAAARNLHEVGERAGVQRMVEVSIIGVDQLTGGYGAAKLAHEQAMLAGPIPTRVLRAAQFYELVPQIVDWGRQGDVSYVQRMRIQPVAARTVAEALVDLATAPEWSTNAGPSEAPIPEVAGPRVEELVDLAGRLVAQRGDAVRIEGVSDPAYPDRELHESGGLLPHPHAAVAGPTFDEWLTTPDAALATTYAS
jgi:uncharacterized protein YbjT (DUF2867 family)